ncbi:MAG: hypothetical protein K0U74_13785 [Alphaproteobacteria bacterium]|nr:hypothetical protein [Alphaproteobacteria bacterium]
MPKKLDFDELDRIACEATRDVRDAARLSGDKIPVWRGGEVVYVEPSMEAGQNGSVEFDGEPDLANFLDEHEVLVKP